MAQLHEKKQALEQYLRELGSVAVAYSSGVDSTFLLKTAHDVLGDKAIAVTAQACLFPGRESAEAAAFCAEQNIRQIRLYADVLSVEGIRQNPKDRCYLCKKHIFTQIRKAAQQEGIRHVAEGSNMDDLKDYRPGHRAIEELGILSPLRRALLTKEEIRALSRELGLPTWNKPSFACLASRFVYGEPITEEKLIMTERAEQLLLDLGFRQFRVRVHGQMARIEIEPDAFDRFMAADTRRQITEYLHTLGFLYVTLDLDGYQTGSMNKTILQHSMEADHGKTETEYESTLHQGADTADR